MTLPILCIADANCFPCRRDDPVGVRFRQRWAKYLNPDGSCPFGKPMGWGCCHPPTPVETKPDPRLDRLTWPRIARWLAKGEKPGDAGVGDVVARLIGKVVTEETWNKWHKRVTGKPCTCASSKAAMNRLYPFAVAANEASGGVVRPTARQVVERAIAGAKDGTSAAVV